MFRPLAFALSLGLALPAAAATFHTDAASFGAATSGAVPVALPNAGNVGLSASVGPLGFLSQSGDLFFGNRYDWSSLIPGNDLAISAPESFTILFLDAVNAFSMLVHEPSQGLPGQTDGCNTAVCSDTTFLIEVLDGISVIDSLTFTPADDMAAFLGVTSDRAFTALRIIDQTNTLDNEYFGAFTLAELAPVPLPASLPLLLAGLGGVAALRRRRQRRQPRA